MKLTSISLTVLVILSLLVFVVLPGCDHGGKRTTNLPPHVSVTGGPPQGGESYYYVTISWVGWDEDGTVKHFLYAIDDTTQWTEIRELEQTFLFTADSLREGEEFGKWHTFWIKAVDNDGAKSLPDYLTFDARTVAPKTTITSPSCDPGVLCQGAIALGTQVKVTWDGEDPDCSSLTKKPVAYQWRLLNLSALLGGAPTSSDAAYLEGLMTTTPENQPDTTSHWSEPRPETEVVLRNLTPGAFYLFAVRAIDEAGAVEPAVRSTYNMFYFKSIMGMNVPRLYVCRDGSGPCVPGPETGDGGRRGADSWRMMTGEPATFRWVADASSYGGIITGYRYGLDITDLNDPSQWATDWSLTVTSATLVFQGPGVHYLYVEAADDVGGTTLSIVELEVFSTSGPDRDVLYVDDFYDVVPGDLAHDNFIQAILTRCLYYTDSVYVFNCWKPGPNNVPREMPMMVESPPQWELSRYRFVIWDTDATQNSFTTGLSGALASGALEWYLNHGGRLWIYGTEIVRGSDSQPLSFSYGTVPPAESFASQFLRISGVVNRPIISTSNRGDGFRRALPNRGVSDQLPTLELDYSKGGSSTVYGKPKVEAVMTAMQDPDLSRRPDTLYFYGANWASTDSSQYHNKACGFRYHDVYSGWKVVYLGFPIHCFFESNAESLATFVTDWMLGDASPSQRRTARR